MKKLNFLLLSFVLLIAACDKRHAIPKSDNYLMFGHFFGMCEGESCIEIFRLEKSRLLEDTKDNYPSSTKFYSGSYVTRSSSNFEACKDLKDAFPKDLLDEATVIGQPDAGDWGGLYIEYNFDGQHKFWLLDLNKGNVPAKYHPFIDKLVEKIALLQ